MLLDTNILIAHLNGDPSAVELFSRLAGKNPLYVSAVSLTELFAYDKLTATDIVVIKKFTSNLVVLPIDARIAERAAFFILKRRLSMADAFIVATASLHSIPLITRDKELLRLREIEVRSL